MPSIWLGCARLLEILDQSDRIWEMKLFLVNREFLLGKADKSWGSCEAYKLVRF